MIMAGGTGGHVFPGLAVAEQVRRAGWRVVWLGSPTGMESRLVPGRGIAMEPVQFSGVRGKGLAAKLLLPFRLLRACWQSARAIFSQRPDVVLGMGGYVSFPGGLMAALLRKPLVIHEQNSVAGMSNRALARLASRVLVAFPGARSGAMTRGTVTGNPVRAEILVMTEPAQRFGARTGPLRVLVIGGSLGAKALNDVLPQALALLPAERRPLVRHQSGEQHLDALQAGYRQAGVEANVSAFIDDMAAAYAEADVMVCRAGALTVSEMAMAGVPGIFVPLPHAVDDHQTGNARYLSDAGAAILLPQPQLTAAALAAILDGLTREQLLGMALKARALAHPDATDRVASICMELAA